jgi:hypothetical protein
MVRYLEKDPLTRITEFDRTVNSYSIFLSKRQSTNYAVQSANADEILYHRTVTCLSEGKDFGGKTKQFVPCSLVSLRSPGHMSIGHVSKCPERVPYDQYERSHIVESGVAT